MSDRWYRLAQSGEPLAQGDLIFRCPILTWKPGPIDASTTELEVLSRRVDAIMAHVVVMTQACDLEHGKVRNVVLNPHTALSDFKQLWAAKCLHGHPASSYVETAPSSMIEDRADSAGEE